MPCPRCLLFDLIKELTTDKEDSNIVETTYQENLSEYIIFKLMTLSTS